MDSRTARARLQVEVDSAIAELDLSEEEAERLAGLLCSRMRPWVKHVYLAWNLRRKKLPHRRREGDKMVG